MPLALVFLAINVLLIVHAVKTGRASPWAFIIIFAPVIGGLAYAVAVLIPELLGSRGARQARQRVITKLDPEKQYRALLDQLEVTDTIANRGALAEECLGLGRFEEAFHHFENILARPMGDEPGYMVGKARAEFGLGRPEDVVSTLDELRARWPDYQSAEAHLLYARALEDSGTLDEALVEYEAVSNYYAGAEARVRYALLLNKMNRGAQAKQVLGGLLTQMRRAPAYVRKAQAEWIRIAERELGT